VFEIGKTLREARLRRQLDFRQVEGATKIRSRYLRALEEEDFESLPSETYVRGFLRSYAEFLGLDGQLYVDEYNSRFVRGEEEVLFRPRRSEPKRAGRGVEANVILLALTAIAVLTALVIAAWKFSAGSSTTAPKRIVPRAPASVVKPKARKPVRADRRAHLVVQATRGSCWLEVHIAKDGRPQKLLYQGTLDKGQRLSFAARQLWMNAGVPENLVVRLNGERVAVGSHAPVVLVISANSVTPAAVR
jgi:hypothetical protein